MAKRKNHPNGPALPVVSVSQTVAAGTQQALNFSALWAASQGLQEEETPVLRQRKGIIVSLSLAPPAQGLGLCSDWTCLT